MDNKVILLAIIIVIIILIPVFSRGCNCEGFNSINDVPNEFLKYMFLHSLLSDGILVGAMEIDYNDTSKDIVVKTYKKTWSGYSLISQPIVLHLKQMNDGKFRLILSDNSVYYFYTSPQLDKRVIIKDKNKEHEYKMI